MPDTFRLSIDIDEQSMIVTAKKGANVEAPIRAPVTSTKSSNLNGITDLKVILNALGNGLIAENKEIVEEEKRRRVANIKEGKANGFLIKFDNEVKVDTVFTLEVLDVIQKAISSAALQANTVLGVAQAAAQAAALQVAKNINALLAQPNIRDNFLGVLQGLNATQINSMANNDVLGITCIQNGVAAAVNRITVINGIIAADGKGNFSMQSANDGVIVVIKDIASLNKQQKQNVISVICRLNNNRLNSDVINAIYDQADKLAGMTSEQLNAVAYAYNTLGSDKTADVAALLAQPNIRANLDVLQGLDADKLHKLVNENIVVVNFNGTKLNLIASILSAGANGIAVNFGWDVDVQEFGTLEANRKRAAFGVLVRLNNDKLKDVNVINAIYNQANNLAGMTSEQLNAVAYAYNTLGSEKTADVAALLAQPNIRANLDVLQGLDADKLQKLVNENIDGINFGGTKLNLIASILAAGANGIAVNFGDVYVKKFGTLKADQKRAAFGVLVRLNNDKLKYVNVINAIYDQADKLDGMTSEQLNAVVYAYNTLGSDKTADVAALLGQPNIRANFVALMSNKITAANLAAMVTKSEEINNAIGSNPDASAAKAVAINKLITTGLKVGDTYKIIKKLSKDEANFIDLGVAKTISNSFSSFIMNSNTIVGAIKIAATVTSDNKKLSSTQFAELIQGLENKQVENISKELIINIISGKTLIEKARNELMGLKNEDIEKRALVNSINSNVDPSLNSEVKDLIKEAVNKLEEKGGRFKEVRTALDKIKESILSDDNKTLAETKVIEIVTGRTVFNENIEKVNKIAEGGLESTSLSEEEKKLFKKEWVTRSQRSVKLPNNPPVSEFRFLGAKEEEEDGSKYIFSEFSFIGGDNSRQILAFKIRDFIPKDLVEIRKKGLEKWYELNKKRCSGRILEAIKYDSANRLLAKKKGNGMDFSS